MEYFEEFFNRLVFENFLDIVEVEIDIDIDCDLLIREEIICVIRKMRNGKVVGLDGILVEVFKVDVEIIVDMLLLFFVKIWE